MHARQVRMLERALLLLLTILAARGIAAPLEAPDRTAALGAASQTLQLSTARDLRDDEHAVVSARLAAAIQRWQALLSPTGLARADIETELAHAASVADGLMSVLPDQQAELAAAWRGVLLARLARERNLLRGFFTARRAAESLRATVSHHSRALGGRAHTELGALYRDMGWAFGFGAQQLAGRHLRLGLIIDPTGASANREMAQWLYQRGETGRSADYLRRALRAHPAESERALILSLLAQTQPNRAPATARAE